MTALPWLLALAAAVSGAAAPALAQDAVKGKRLFDDTVNSSGLNGLTGNCASCHGSVENRRLKIGGSRYAEISPSLANDRFRVAVASEGAMRQFEALSAEQIQDLAAYLADTPRFSPAQIQFTAAVVNVPAAPKSATLAHAVATSKTLRVISVAVEGPEAARFSRTADACDGQTLATSVTCTVSVQFAAPDTAGKSASLVLTLQETGSTETFQRTVALTGAVVPPPPSPAAPAADSGGGGSMSGSWVAALAVAALALVRVNQRAARRARRKQSEPKLHEHGTPPP